MTATNASVGELLVAVPNGTSPTFAPTTGQNQYRFTVQANDEALQIIDNNTGLNLSAQTNTVIVGQQMNFTAKLSVTNSSLTNQPLANFQWSVPGVTFSDYVADASSAVLYTNFSTTLSNTMYYWSDDATNRIVQCAATFNGAKIIGRAVFNIIRPEVTWTLTPKDAVAVDTNHLPVEGFIGYYFLRTGKSYTTNDVGMYFSFKVTNLKGYTNDYDIEFYQVAAINWRRNIQGEISGSAFVNGTGYDKLFPVPWLGYSKTNGYAIDTPAHVLTSANSFVWRSDNFQDYLMFTPAGGKPVPLKFASWNWYGRAQNVNSNIPPVFIGITPFTNQMSAIGVDCFTHPIWATNIEDIKPNWQYNTTTYPTP